jgi:hypothetical protein
MKIWNATLKLAASDASDHIARRHLTFLDLDMARGNHEVPDWKYPDAWALKGPGLGNEDAYLRRRRGKGLCKVT